MKRSFITLFVISLLSLTIFSCDGSSGGGGSDDPNVPQDVQTAPASPSTPSITVNGLSITVTWGSVSEATAYEVYQSTTDNISGASKVYDGSTLSYTANGLTNGVTYYY